MTFPFPALGSACYLCDAVFGQSESVVGNEKEEGEAVGGLCVRDSGNGFLLREIKFRLLHFKGSKEQTIEYPRFDSGKTIHPIRNLR